MFDLFGKFNGKKREESPSISILVIEDSLTDRMFIQRVLRKANFEVAAVENGREGITLAERKAPDVIILDNFLPDISGLEVCRILKENPGTKDIPVVFLTVAESGYTLFQCYEAGAYTFLNKPICAKELIRQVEVTLQDQREGEQEYDL